MAIRRIFTAELEAPHTTVRPHV